MQSKFLLDVKAIALIVIFALIFAGLLLVIKTKRHDSVQLSTERNSRPVAKHMNRGTTDTGSVSSTSPTDLTRPHGGLRGSIESQATKQGKSVTEVAIARINEARLSGSAEGIYEDLMLAFWDTPVVFLESLKATAQGKELQFVTAVYLSKSEKEQAPDHIEKAYNTLSPGGARSSVAGSWACHVGMEVGIDAAITLIQKLEMPQEKITAVVQLESLIRRSGLELSSDQRDQLKLLKRTK